MNTVKALHHNIQVVGGDANHGSKKSARHCEEAPRRSNLVFELCLIAIITLLSSPIFAQTGNGIGNEQVIVIKEYEATIQDAQKINIQPNIPELEEKKPKLDYTVPVQEFKDISFEANPLKPIAISKEKLQAYNNSYIKIGMGSQLMPLVQFAYNDNKTKNLQFGIMYDHLSAYGWDVKNQRFSDDKAGVYLKYFPKKVEIGTAFNFRNYRTHFYGTDSTYTEKQVRQVFRTYDASAYIKNAQKNKAEIDIKQTLNFNYFQETFGGAHEWYMAGQTDFNKTFKQYHAITASFNFDVSTLNRDTVTLNRTLFTPMVGYAFNNDDWRAHASFGLSIDGKLPIFACNIHVEKRLYEHSLIAYLEYVRSDQKNSLSSLAFTNNYIQNNIAIHNSTVGKFAAGFKGTLQDFSYNVAFHLVQDKHMPLFVNDSTDMKRFVAVYDSNAIIYNAHFEAGYNAKEWLRFLLVGDYNFYQLKNNAQAWQQPAFKTTFRANYIWKDKISVTLDLYGITSSVALLPENQTAKLKGTADLNLGAEYFFNKHLSFFATLNNIANVKYQQWYHYPTYGINGMIGGKFAF